jgi:hypothetical protein
MSEGDCFASSLPPNAWQSARDQSRHSARQGTGAADRHLLTQDGPEGQLEPVSGARYPESPLARDEWSEPGIVLERGRDRGGIEIEIEHPSQPLNDHVAGRL